MSKKTKQTMYCVYSPWGFHRCYGMKSDAEKDAKESNRPKYDLMHHSVIECKIEITPNYKLQANDKKV